MKHCSRCNQDKEEKDFRPSDRYYCRECRRQYEHDRRAKNPEKEKQRMARWRQQNRTKLAEASRRWREANPEKAKEVAARSRAKHKDEHRARHFRRMRMDPAYRKKQTRKWIDRLASFEEEFIDLGIGNVEEDA